MRRLPFSLLFFAIVLPALISMPARGANLPAFKTLQAVIGRYQKAGGIKSKIERTVTIALLDQTTVSHGELSLSKGRVRIDLKAPDPTTVVFDRSLMWVITPTPRSLGGRPQVLEIKSSAINRQDEAPLALLLGDEKAWSLFKVKSEKRAKNQLTVDLEKKKKSAEGIQTIQIRLDTTERVIDELSYTDDIGNLTKFTFNQTQFRAHLRNAIFQFHPPKNAEITVMN